MHLNNICCRSKDQRTLRQSNRNYLTQRAKRNGASVTWGTIPNILNRCNLSFIKRKDREYSQKYWRNNGPKVLKYVDQPHLENPRSSANPNQNKYIENHTYGHHCQTIKSKVKKFFLKKSENKRNILYRVVVEKIK